MGSQIDPSIRGYYIDFRLKTDDPAWPPYFHAGVDAKVHVGLCQWGLGCYEHYVCGGGEPWLEGALATARELVSMQEKDGPMRGGWVHRLPLDHTFRLEPPWLSAMAQGEGASVLIRAWRETGDDTFAEAARLALEPMWVSAARGGVRAELGGGFFPEEYPTKTPSYVLNGCIFALWGCYDVAQALSDARARQLFDDGVETLARELHRFDLGNWSRYDLYPHPVVNIASSAYHLLHINQLRAMSRIAPRPVFGEVAERWEGYMRSRPSRISAFARKSAFRVAVPRNEVAAKRLPWSQWKTNGDVLVLCYHAVSEEWPAVLSITPAQFEAQLSYLADRGYHATTFHNAVTSPLPAGRTVAITFDDAYRSVYEVAAPILARYGMVATVFVPTGKIDTDEPMVWPGIDNWIGTEYEKELVPMTWDQCRELDAIGWEIGSHTVSHPRLTTLDDQSLADELSRSKRTSELAMGVECKTIAYPYGDEDPRVEAAVAAAGYERAAALPSPVLHKPRPHSWPRLGVYGPDDMTRFKRKVSPVMRRLRSHEAWRLVQARHRVRRPAP